MEAVVVVAADVVARCEALRDVEEEVEAAETERGAVVARLEAGWKGASEGTALRLDARALEAARGWAEVAETGGGRSGLAFTGEDAGRGSRDD